MNFEEIVKGKVLSPQQLMRWLAVWRLHSKKIVFTNGCFDILHPGHIHLLNTARSYGDILIVGLNTDSSVRKIKPSRPVNDENSRATLVASLEVVDAVIMFGEETPLELIKQIKPDVLVKGGDYKPEDVVGKAEMESWGGKVVIVPFLEGFSTTSLIEKMKKL